MPTVLREGPYRFFFHSHEPGEPAHIHVQRDAQRLKFWLQPLRLARNDGFAATEVRKVRTLVEHHQPFLLEAWHEYFSPRR